MRVLNFLFFFLFVACLFTQSISKLFVLGILYFLVKYGRSQDKIYNPFNILCVTCLSYMCYYQPLGGVFLGDISVTTQVLIILCLFAVFLGMFVVSRKNIASIDIGNRCANFWIVFIVGALPTMVAIYMFGNTLDMSGEEMMETKEKMTIPFWGQFAYWLPTSIIVACKKNNTKLIVFSLIASLYVALVSVTKTGMLMACLFFAIGVTTFKPDIMKHRIALFLKKYAIIWMPVLMLSYFVYNNSIRHEASTNSSMEYLERSGTSIVHGSDNVTQGMFLNYLYYCSPWSNLDYNVRLNHERGYGKNTFGQFAHLLRIDEKRVPKMNPTFLNTHTFITDFYIDFGYVGAIIASFLLGCLIFYFYKKCGMSNDPLLIGFYVLIAYATFMMFFSNHFVNGYLLNYFITLVGFSYLLRKNVVK